MRPERWVKIQEIFAGALEREPAERSDYLIGVCTDPSLRQEVELMIAAHEQGESGFLEPADAGRKEALQDGTKIGPYEVLAAIGAGGMGEVYLARDTRLGRDVAIKVLPAAFARDPERLARFQREAKFLASLNHPNIASIYGLEESADMHALVMELVEGPTLADRIKAGPIAIGEALSIARQICEALEYAHERGVVHRDLKPANIKISPEDSVKILDFGVAKAVHGEAKAPSAADSPTLSEMATRAGVLLGTAAYMSPEQAKGKPVDRRADIWGFGCVLFEMLTGKPAFAGDGIAETLAAVLMNEPDWSLLPSATPVHVRVLLQRCLQKDPKQRLRDIGDARISLDEVLSGAADGTIRSASSSSAWRRALPWVAGLVSAAVIGAIVLMGLKPHSTALPATVQRFEVLPPDPSVYSVGALSPDGTKWAIGAGGGNIPPSGLWLRRMDSPEAHPLEGTERASGIPFWSEDSRFLVFGTMDGKLEKVDTVDGGPPQVLCGAGIPVAGGFWTPDGDIIFSDMSRPPGLWRVPASGGTPLPVQGMESDAADKLPIFPVLLPDRKHFLYQESSSTAVIGNAIYVESLNSNPGQPKPAKLVDDALGLAYTPSPSDPNFGYLLFVRPGAPGDLAGTLMAQRINLRKLAMAGDPVSIAHGVEAVRFSASLTGMLVYGSGGPARVSQLTVFGRRGEILESVGDPAYYTSVAFSPDGKRVAASRGTQGPNMKLWIMDLVRGVSTQFTFDLHYSDENPVWSPDGSRIIFSSGPNRNNFNLDEKLSNGGGEVQLLLKSDSNSLASSWSNDGRFLLFGEGALWNLSTSVLPLDANAHAAGKPFLLAQKGFGFDPRFSPRPAGTPLWIAYSSKESGRYEIYVRPFDPKSPSGMPAGGGKFQISTEGGVSPRWNGNGRELFYVAPDGTVMSVEVGGTNATFHSGIPKPLFKPTGIAPHDQASVDWDATTDGRKFIFHVPASATPAAPPTKFTVVLNWPSLLKKRGK